MPPFGEAWSHMTHLGKPVLYLNSVLCTWAPLLPSHLARVQPHLDVLGVGSLQLLAEMPIRLQHVDDFLEVAVVVQARVLGGQG